MVLVLLVLLVLFFPVLFGSCLGHGVPRQPEIPFVDTDGDGVEDSADCAPEDASIYPGAEELCDDIDQDCDGNVDWGAIGDPSYYDRDGDGFGDPTMVIYTCLVPEGYVSEGTDCDDHNAAISPFATEVCDGLDNDCEGTIDLNATDGGSWYTDLDLDGYGAGEPVVSCGLLADRVANGDDCDDNNATINPLATEVCDPLNVDEDCNGLVDDADWSADPATWTSSWVDADGDGYGDPALQLWTCDIPVGCVTNGSDCDDTDPARWVGDPGACE